MEQTTQLTTAEMLEELKNFDTPSITNVVANTTGPTLTTED